MGQRIDPYGTPVVMGNGSEMWWPNFTLLCPVRKVRCKPPTGIR